MSKIVIVLWVVAVLCVVYRPVKCTNIHPCCHISFIDPSELYSVFRVQKIVINSPTICSGVNVGQIMVKTKNGSVKTVCVNGFNVVSFLLNVLQRVERKSPTSHADLIQILETYRQKFIEDFSVRTANSSQFASSLTSIQNNHNGTMAK
ncbi:envelope glycoprotein L [Vespertilionid gammaherpesvirus 1]|uniref:Envelope glycoprotein L n=1 Tax=Vespertilionid gammaherpesvirus 1 TaxID=2560830 RepID=A0A109QG30_9GAMA|nr:envelope glycoprotein L [Myotis gammaherpesvirus 8]AMA67402.1 envelope glycoprotein L [Vespertilionid gammaherpesvirus 1]